MQYLAGQHQEDELTKRTMELVLEDFMTQMKELKVKWLLCNRNSLIWKIVYLKSVSFANQLNVRQSLSRINLILPIRSVWVTNLNG